MADLNANYCGYLSFLINICICSHKLLHNDSVCDELFLSYQLCSHPCQQKKVLRVGVVFKLVIIHSKIDVTFQAIKKGDALKLLLNHFIIKPFYKTIVAVLYRFVISYWHFEITSFLSRQRQTAKGQNNDNLRFLSLRVFGQNDEITTVCVWLYEKKGKRTYQIHFSFQLKVLTSPDDNILSG